MKKQSIAIILFVIFFAYLSPISAHAESCPVEKVIGAKVSPGIYKINVKKESSNLYKVTGQDIYIKTNMCLELAIGDDAILEITSYSGYRIGEIHFSGF